MRRLRLPSVETKAPIAVAALIAVPAYIAALLATSLALDRPHIVGGKELNPTGATEARVWLAALIAPGIMIAAGLVGLALRRYGIYLVGIAGIVVCLVLPSISHAWIAGHTRRFPLGVDLIKDSDPSNLSTRGEWEHAAQTTISSITHWTLGLAIGCIVVAALFEVRRRTGATNAIAAPPPESTIVSSPQAPL